MFCSLALLLTAIADISISTPSGLMWYEPDCPKELWK